MSTIYQCGGIKISVNEKFDLGRAENIAEKKKMLVPTMFSKALCLRVVKSRKMCGKELKEL